MDKGENIIRNIKKRDIARDEFIKAIEERMNFYKKINNKKMENYCRCLLDIAKNNTINNNEYVYAYIEGIEEDSYPEPYIKANIVLMPRDKKKEED